MRRPHTELYRLPDQGKVAGVCAGVAEYFGFETWLVRIVFISGVLLSGAMFVVAYVAAWFILDVKPGSEKQENKTKGKKPQWQKHWHHEEVNAKVRSHFSDKPVEVKEKVWQAGEPPKQAFHDIAGQFGDLEKRLQNLETYVTSTEYTVAREINRL